MPSLAILALALCGALAPQAAAKETALTAILANLDRVRSLKPMDPHRKYDLEARGVQVSGLSDDFLRRRTPEEILRSGLSCGCGDFAGAFIFLMESRGFETTYLDSVALTYTAVEHGDSGHTGAAVKDPLTGNWILVDPTSNRILSGDWDPASRVYEGPAGRFWIGYKGPLDKFPAKDHPALRTFYAETLKTVPKALWERQLWDLQFTVDPSMRTPDGACTHPHMDAFLARPAKTFKLLGIQPSRSAKVTLKALDRKPGGDDAVQEADGTWTFYVAKDSAMSASATDWLTTRIARMSRAH